MALYGTVPPIWDPGISIETCLSLFFTCSSNFHHAFMDVYAEILHLNHSETQPFSRLHTIAETAGGMGSAAPDVRAVDL